MFKTGASEKHLVGTPAPRSIKHQPLAATAAPSARHIAGAAAPSADQRLLAGVTSAIQLGIVLNGDLSTRSYMHMHVVHISMHVCPRAHERVPTCTCDHVYTAPSTR